MFFALKTVGLVGAMLSPVPPVDGYSLKYAPMEGATYTCKLTGKMDLQGVEADFASTVVQKVLKVDSDGTYSMQFNTVEGDVKYSGESMKMPKSSTVTVYKADGEAVSVSGEQTDPVNSLRVQMLTMLKRPDGPMKLLDTWTEDVKADAVTKRPGLHGLFKLVSEETVGKFNTLKITATLSESEITVPGNTSMSFWINKDDGSMVKYECTYTNMPYPGSPSPLSGSLMMLRADN